jgi:hypothetical protein
MSFATTTDVLRIQSLKNTNQLLNKTKTQQCFSCLSLMCLKGKLGSMRAIMYNTITMFIAFYVVFDTFPLQSRYTTTNMIKNMMPMTDFNAIVDFNTYFQWHASFTQKALTFVTDYNQREYNDVNNVRQSLVWNSVQFAQTRVDGNAMCQRLQRMKNPMAIEKLSNILLLQGVDCKDPRTKHGMTFGQTINTTDGSFYTCPFYPSNHSAEFLSPFKPFGPNMNGYQTRVVPDPRLGQYIYLANTGERVMGLLNLRYCNWLDLRTREVNVRLVFWNHATQEIGLIEHIIVFDELGRATPKLYIDMAEFRDLNREASVEHPPVDPAILSRGWSFTILSLCIGHKGFLQVTSFLFYIINATCCKKQGNSVGNKNQKRPWTCLRLLYGTMFIMCEAAILWIAVLFWSTGYTMMELGLYLLKTVADLGSYGYSRADYMLLSNQIEPSVLSHINLELDTLTQILLERITAEKQLKIIAAAYLLNIMVDLMRHFYNNPYFSMVPKTIAYGLKRLSYLFVVLGTIMLVYGTYCSLSAGQYYEAFTNPLAAFFTLHLSLLGETDYYDDISSEVTGINHFFW